MRNEVFKDGIKYMLPTIIIVIIIECLNGYINVFTSNIVGEFANSILSKNINLSLKNITTLAIALLINIIIYPSLFAIQNIVMFKASLRHDRFIINKFLHKNYLSIKHYDAGEISYRLETDPVEFRWNIINIFSNPFIIIFDSIILGYYLFSESCIYGIVTILAAFVPIVIAISTKNLEVKYKIQNREYNDKKWTLETDIYQNFAYVKVWGLQNTMINDLNKLFHLHFNKTILKEAKCKSLIEFLNNIVNQISKLIVIIFGSYLASKDKINIGLIASFLGYLTFINKIVSNTSNLIKEIPSLKQNTKRIEEFYKDLEKNDGYILNSKIKTINISNLSFTFNNENSIFPNISLVIHKGQKIMLRGTNGSGKSTLLKCISGLYPNYKGKIYINNLNLNSINKNSFRKQIAFIEQTPYLFKGTIYENIKLGNLNISDIELKSILDYVNIKLNLDTLVTNEGKNLSGGEKQKISVARALIKNSPILILDEPLNNLDFDTQDIIYKIINDTTQTVIYVSHDKKTSKLADQIYTITNA